MLSSMLGSCAGGPAKFMPMPTSCEVRTSDATSGGSAAILRKGIAEPPCKTRDRYTNMRRPLRIGVLLLQPRNDLVQFRLIGRKRDAVQQINATIAESK